MFRIFLLLILFTNASAQIDTSKIKFRTYSYHDCLLSEQDFDGALEDISGIDSATVQSSQQTILTGNIDILYPHFSCKDFLLEKYLNDTIKKIVNIYQDASENVVKCAAAETDSVFLPSTEKTNYSVDFLNKNFLSVSVLTDVRSSENNNESDHQNFHYTFDLKKKKLLQINTVLRNKKDTAFFAKIFFSACAKKS